MSILDMTNRFGKRQAGVSLIELIMFIVIVSVGLAGILSVMNVATKSSTDPQLRKQALAIAEGLLEEIELARFTFCDPLDTNAEVATGANTTAAGCAGTVENVGQESGGPVRPFDNVNDYVSAFFTLNTSYTADLSGTPLTTGYSAAVMITPEPLGSPAIASTTSPAAMNVLRITVTVTYNGTSTSTSGPESITLDGYRTRYAPTLMP